MSFASLINLCPRQSPLSRSSRKSSRSSYNPSVKWKSFEKKVSLHFSRTMPLICAHLLISSPSFTALRLALSRRARCESFPDLTLLEVFAFLFQTTDGSGRVIFKMFERPWHRFSCSLLPFFLSTLSSSVAAFIPTVAGLSLFSLPPFIALSSLQHTRSRLSLIWTEGRFARWNSSLVQEQTWRRKLSLFPPGNGRTKNIEQSKFKLAMLMRSRQGTLPYPRSDNLWVQKHRVAYDSILNYYLLLFTHLWSSFPMLDLFSKTFSFRCYRDTALLQSYWFNQSIWFKNF